MAQIIKHRRGQLSGLKNLAANNAELVVASGSIGADLQGPFLFVGSPVLLDDKTAGAFSPASKIYTGTNAPEVLNATYGTTLDGLPFYASGNHSLYILNNTAIGGNTKLNLVGNIEGGTISG